MISVALFYSVQHEDMAKSGYAAIGHLLLLGKSHAEKVEILQKICKKVCLRLTSEFVQVDGIKERLNLFFGTVKPTADNFAKVNKTHYIASQL